MFQVDDYVVYGSHGVCKVTDIGPIEISMADKDKVYYTLQPIYKKDSVIYAPIENGRIVMRYVISKEEAEQLLQDIPSIESMWITNDRDREGQYKAALKTCDCRELVKIIKTITQRKEARIQCGKKVTAVDERYFKQVADQLDGELAFALGREKDTMGSYITLKLTELAQNSK